MSAGIASFPPPSLARQLAELERERSERLTARDVLDLAAKRSTRLEVEHRNSALNGAITTLQRLVDAQKAGMPSRADVFKALREALLYIPDIGSSAELHARITDMLEKVPE